jgi:hypothetical protein
MKIVERLNGKGVHLSCEVFPPKEFARVEEARPVVRGIAALKPAYVSVTYGAAGRTPHFTRELAQTVQAEGVPALAHLTCINDTVGKIDTVLDDLQASGVTNVLALRGIFRKGRRSPTATTSRTRRSWWATSGGAGASAWGRPATRRGTPRRPTGPPTWTTSSRRWTRAWIF